MTDNTVHERDGHKIRTHFVFPPIPYRNMDWCAVSDDYEGGDPIGYGATEDAAITDLLEQLNDV